MDKKVFQLILGSASPRRHELLKHTYLNFKVVTSDIDEISHFQNPVEIVKDLALQKAKHVYNKLSEDADFFVIGADTIVVVDNKILGKPKSKDDAKKMLMNLSNRTHQVFTGVSFVWQGNEFTFHDSTSVTFEKITKDLLDLYIATGESMDKAGSYGIQGAALGFIKEVKGSYSNVVGLPVDKVLINLKNVMSLDDDNFGEWRKRFC